MYLNLTMRDVPDPNAAEAVRAYLVAVRGGAPFLSPMDSRTLADWLDNGVSVGAILRAVDAVAARRIANRTRAPFTLTSCKGEVKRRAGRMALSVPIDLAARLAHAPPRAGAGTDEDAALHVLADAALAEIGLLAEADAETRALAACAVARRFHERAWDATLATRPAAVAQAALDLEDVRMLYSDAEFARACEEAARDALRQRFPALTATRIWAEFGVGG